MSRRPGRACRFSRPTASTAISAPSFNPEIDVVSVATHKIIDKVTQASPFCPNIAATPDGTQVWFTLKDIGKTQVFNARPPFNLLKTIDTGPITNHVNFARTAKGTFAYVTIGGLNQVKVFRTDDFSPVATIPVGNLPHGVWPSGDGTRIYVGLENADAMTAIDTRTNTVIATVPIGQAPQAIAYVPNAVPNGDGMAGLEPLGKAGNAVHLSLGETGQTSVTLFDQGLTQVLQASATGLAPKSPYVIALATQSDGGGALQPLASFMTNPAGSAIVNTVGPIRQIVAADAADQRRYLVIVPGTADNPGKPVQVQK